MQLSRIGYRTIRCNPIYSISQLAFINTKASWVDFGDADMGER